MPEKEITIGQRAVKAIDKKAEEYGITAMLECAQMGIDMGTYRGWKNSRYEPSAFFLKQMALAGYDVFWILTGRKENG